MGIVRIGDGGVGWLRVLGGGLVDAAQGGLIGGSGSASGLVLVSCWGAQFCCGFIQLGGVDADLPGSSAGLFVSDGAQANADSILMGMVGGSDILSCVLYLFFTI